jgi:hypothetical protein
MEFGLVCHAFDAKDIRPFGAEIPQQSISDSGRKLHAHWYASLIKCCQ